MGGGVAMQGNSSLHVLGLAESPGGPMLVQQRWSVTWRQNTE